MMMILLTESLHTGQSSPHCDRQHTGHCHRLKIAVIAMTMKQKKIINIMVMMKTMIKVVMMVNMIMVFGADAVVLQQGALAVDQMLFIPVCLLTVRQQWKLSLEAAA